MTQDISRLKRETNEEKQFLQQINDTLEEKQRLLGMNLSSLARSINTTIGELHHFETGWMNCDDSSFYNGGSSDRSYANTKTFAKAYKKAPIVFLYITELQGNDRYDEIWFTAKVTSVSATQFTVTCTARGRSQINDLDVFFLSIPRP